jgi:hypothetical protein
LLNMKDMEYSITFIFVRKIEVFGKARKTQTIPTCE